MKKFIVAGMLALTLLVGFANKTNADDEVSDTIDDGIICLTVPIDCSYMGGEPMGYGLVCGATGEERIKEYCELLDAVCE